MAVTTNFQTALADTVVLIKGGGGVLKGYVASNIDAADAFVQCFDAAAATDVTLGTTPPALPLPIPAGDATLRGHAIEDIPGGGFAFTNGLCAAVTTTADGSSAGATAADVTFLLQ